MIDIARTHHKGAVLSVVTVDGQTFHGIERPWLDNRPLESCIPTGQYALVPYSSTKYPDVWAFVGGTVGVARGERYNCLIHIANYVHDVVGCLGLGMKPGEKDGLPCVWSSGAAIAELRCILDGRPWTPTTIRWS